MSKPTAQECSAAAVEGETARRASTPISRNPYRNNNTERGHILAENWDDGWARQDRRNRR